MFCKKYIIICTDYLQAEEMKENLEEKIEIYKMVNRGSSGEVVLNTNGDIFSIEMKLVDICEQVN